MADSLRERRIAAERSYLEMLAASNPGRLTALGWSRDGESDYASVRLLDTPAWLLDGTVGRVHEVRLVFPGYFPSVPIEGYLARPVIHPNVHPENGFICLWEKRAAGDTVIEALLQVQRVITWRLWNASPEHVMQPDLAVREPLAYVALAVPAEIQLARTAGHIPGARRRLELR